MNAGTLSGIFTALALLAFGGVVAWAFSVRRHTAFREASSLPLEDDTAQAPGS